MFRRGAYGVLGFFLVLACSGEPSAEDEPAPSGAVCPPGSTLTYETFTRDFMGTYCTRCHASSIGRTERNGAPSHHDFDTLAGIRATPTEHLDEQAAAGPAHVNTAMPPTAPKPSTREREQLGEWLACGMP